MGVSPAEGSDCGGIITGCGDLDLPPSENNCSVHCDQAHYIYVSGGGAEAGVKGGQVMVGVGKLGLGGDIDSVLGGGMGGGEGGYVQDRDEDRLNIWGR